MSQIQGLMRAIALDQFGDLDTLKLQTLPIPEIGPTEVLLRVHAAGVGAWDPFEREGGYATMMGTKPTFPYILGSEGSGVVAEVGDDVKRFKPGDRVYASSFLNPKGGFYAEYVAVDEDYVSFIPGELTMEQAGVMSGVGITALRGLDDRLNLQPGETVLIFGASGGIGHMAVQLARRLRARVISIASGQDGVALVKELGSDVVIEGHERNLLAALEAVAPLGVDTALLTAGGDAAEQAILAVRKGGRVAYPNGINPVPRPVPGIDLKSYNGEPDADIIRRLNHLIEPDGFRVHIAQTFSLDQAAEAHRALNKHHPGKIALHIRS